MRSWLLKREKKGAYNNILQELRLTDEENFRKYLQINTETFQILADRTKIKLTKKVTNMREPIPADVKLAVTLRFLATGESYNSLMYQYRVSKAALGLFVPEVCNVIIEDFQDEFIRFLTTSEEWESLADGFEKICQFPTVLVQLTGSISLL